MSNQVAFTILSSLISLFGLTYLIFWRYRLLITDSFRQSLFELRDELFDFAAAGNIPFDDPAYGMLRKLINGYMRFAHQATIWHALMLALTLTKEDKAFLNNLSFDKDWSKALAKLTPEVRQELVCVRSKLDDKAFFYFLVSCPELFVFALFGLVVFIVSKLGIEGSAIIWERMRKRFSEAENVALFYGDVAT